MPPNVDSAMRNFLFQESVSRTGSPLRTGLPVSATRTTFRETTCKHQKLLSRDKRRQSIFGPTGCVLNWRVMFRHGQMRHAPGLTVKRSSHIDASIDKETALFSRRPIAPVLIRGQIHLSLTHQFEFARSSITKHAPQSQTLRRSSCYSPRISRLCPRNQQCLFILCFN
jgi:hypothetical protein